MDSSNNNTREKEELLRLLLKERLQNPPEEKEHPVSETPVLSFAQERLWFLDQLIPDSCLYNMPLVLRLLGPLDIPALEKSLNEILRRHEILRTNIRMQDTITVQTLEPFEFTPLQVFDICRCSHEDICHRINKESRRPFDLSRDILFRGALYKLAEEEHILLLVLHHIAADGWSLKVLCEELSCLYQAFTQNCSSPLPDLPVQYDHYARCQRLEFTKQNLEQRLGYWQQQLHGIPAGLTFPSGKVNDSIKHDIRGRTASFTIPASVTSQLKALSQQYQCSLYMTVLTGFAILLSRHTNEEDIVIGSPIAGRDRQEYEGLIGFFINFLVLRINLSDAPVFTQLLTQVRQTTLDAYTHQDLPFAKLVEALQPERNINQHPLFQVVLSWQEEPASPVKLSGLKSLPFELDNTIARFDLALSIDVEKDHLRGALEYKSDIFDSDTADRIITNLKILLAGIANNPDRRICELPMLSPVETHQLLVDWNNSATQNPKEKCVHHLFEQQAQNTPQAPAVVFNDDMLTYRELDRQASNQARQLRKLGVGPEVLVAVELNRSMAMIVAILAIFKAGGAYVPLDPDYPPNRLETMLNDARPRLLLTEKSLISKLPKTNTSPPVQIIYIEELGAMEFDSPGIEPDKSFSGPFHTAPANSDGTGIDNLAYVIYTSGTSGAPKGAMIEHKGLVNTCLDGVNFYGFDASDRILQFASLSFDPSIYQIFMAFLSGACLVLIDRETITGNPRDFEDFLNAQNITSLDVPPGYLNLLDGERLPKIRTIITGGEFPNRESVRYYCGTRQYINLWGTTETTILSTHHRVTPDREYLRGIPVGKPIANTQIYILDTYNTLKPVGAVGEICISGEGVGRGYLNDPKLTQAKFIPNPFLPGKLMYKSGDLGKWLPEGELLIMGREDFQVKIRGFRVELDEIETHLQGIKNVKDAVVITRNSAGATKLVAYMITDPSLSSETIRNKLLRDLPEHMVPSFFVPLEKFPVTPNGKIDRKALLVLGKETIRKAEHEPAKNKVEKRLAVLWENTLAVENVGRRDNFFELGGHSMAAMELMVRIRQTFHLNIPLVDVYQNPTLAVQAQCLENLKSNTHYRQGDDWTFRLNKNKGTPLFCFPSVIGFHWEFLPLASKMTDNSLYAFDAVDAEDAIQRYVRSIRKLQPQGPYHLGAYCAGGSLAFQAAKKLEESGEATGVIILFDSECKTQSVSLARDELSQLTDELFNRPRLLSRIPVDTLKGTVRNNISTGMRSYLATPPTGRINTDIHIILAAPPRDLAKSWQQVTKGQVYVHQGTGSHESMLDQDNIDHNLAIVKKILASI